MLYGPPIIWISIVLRGPDNRGETVYGSFHEQMHTSEEKGPPSPMSIILITYRQMWYVCVDLQLLSLQLQF